MVDFSTKFIKFPTSIMDIPTKDSDKLIRCKNISPTEASMNLVDKQSLSQ